MPIDNEKLEAAVLSIIADGRARCGAGFGQYPQGILTAVSILLPLVPESARVKESFADFTARLEA